MTNKLTPMIDAFLESWKKHLKENNKEEYLKYMIVGIDDNTEIYDEYSEFTTKFVYEYVTKIPFDLETIIKEYGMKKLIDLMCEYNGDEICDELFEFNKHKIVSGWVDTMLCRILKVY